MLKSILLIPVFLVGILSCNEGKQSHFPQSKRGNKVNWRGAYVYKYDLQQKIIKSKEDQKIIKDGFNQTIWTIKIDSSQKIGTLEVQEPHWASDYNITTSIIEDTISIKLENKTSTLLFDYLKSAEIAKKEFILKMYKNNDSTITIWNKKIEIVRADKSTAFENKKKQVY